MVVILVGVGVVVVVLEGDDAIHRLYYIVAVVE